MARARVRGTAARGGSVRDGGEQGFGCNQEHRDYHMGDHVGDRTSGRFGDRIGDEVGRHVRDEQSEERGDEQAYERRGFKVQEAEGRHWREPGPVSPRLGRIDGDRSGDSGRAGGGGGGRSGGSGSADHGEKEKDEAARDERKEKEQEEKAREQEDAMSYSYRYIKAVLSELVHRTRVTDVPDPYRQQTTF